MCYSLIVGKKASKTGKAILAANDDWPGCPGHILYEGAHDYIDKDQFQLVNGAYIPQVNHTFSYVHSSAAYDTGWRKESWNEGVNEYNVAVSLDGIYAFKNIESHQGLQADDVPILILERARSAREGVALVGKLIDEYGFCVSDIDGAAGAVVVAIADPDEGFFMEILPGGIWVAKRVDDDVVEVRPNCLGIHEVDFKDEFHYMCSDNVISSAIGKGWYNGKDPFDFAEVYSTNEAICEYGGPDDDVNKYRRWNGIYRLAKLDTEIDSKTYYAKAENVTIEDVKLLLGDGLQGTKYDLRNNPGAGLHKNPFYQDINISVGQAGTVVGMVVDYSCMDDPTGSLIWFSLGNVSISPFVPCYFNSSGLPNTFTRGKWGEYSEGSAWFVMEELCEQVYKRYDVVMPYIKKKQEYWTKKFNEKLKVKPIDADTTKKLTNEYSLWLLGQVKETIYYLKGHCIANTFVDESDFTF